jgi:hypothetical protein
MSTNQMDYFDQKPGLDLTEFFEGKGMKLDEEVPVAGAGAPPPKDTYWCANTDNTEETEQG